MRLPGIRPPAHRLAGGRSICHSRVDQPSPEPDPTSFDGLGPRNLQVERTGPLANEDPVASAGPVQFDDWASGRSQAWSWERIFATRAGVEGRCDAW